MTDAFPPGLVEDAKNFRSTRRSKFARLKVYCQLVLDMRANYASFKAIANLLSKHGVRVGKTQIQHFCQEVLGEPARRRPRKVTKANNRPSALEKIPAAVPTQLPQQSVPNASPPLQTTPLPAIHPKKGPRIAKLELFDDL